MDPSFDDFFKHLSFENKAPKRGDILISEPFLNDPNFVHSVVLLVKHNSEGTIGFVLNEESKYNVDEIVRDFPKFNSRAYIGGPVGQDSLFYLHTKGDTIEGSLHIHGDLYWGGDYEQVKKMIVDGELTSADILFFVGYSGWGEDQLDRELEEKSWIVAQLPVKKIMQKHSKDLWNEILKNMGKQFKIMSNFPENPSLN